MAVHPSPQFGEGKDDIDLADIARSLRRQFRKIIYVAAATTLIALFLVLSANPYFSVTGSFYFGDAQSQNLPQNGAGVNLLTDFQTINDVPTQVALIQSRALVEQSILETGLNVDVKSENTGPISYWKWRFLDHESIDAYAPKPGDLKVLYATLFDPGSGGAAFDLQFGQNGTYSLFGTDGAKTPVLTGTLGQPAAGTGVTMLIKLAVDGPPPAAGSEYHLIITPSKSLAEGLIGGNLTVAQGGSATVPTQTADISLLWSDPYKGQIFVDQLMKDFIATQLSWKTESASDTETFVSQQLQNIQTSLDSADDKLATYQAQTGIVNVPANAQAVVNQLSQYEVQRTTAQLQEQALQQLVASTSTPQTGLNPYLVTQANDPTLAQLAGSLATAQIQLQAQSLQFTPSSPELQTQEATVQRTEEAIHTLLKNDEALAAGNVANLDTLIAKYEGELKSVPAQSLQVTELTRASDVFGQLYVLLMQNEEEAEVSKAATIVNTRIVSPPEVPLYATSPKGATTVLAGMIIGLFLGTILVLVQRVLAGHFHSEGDVQRTSSLPIYGLIPARTKDDMLLGAVPRHPRNSFTEAFRLLRNRIYQTFSDGSGGSRIILVTSPTARDGKTTIAVNLAKTIGDDGKKVLLVDGDLHRGRLHEALRVRQSPGLTELLAGREGSRPQPVPGQNFWALSAGTYAANPPNLLKEPALELTFNVLRNDFDYIIVDCPPLPSVVDTLTFGRFADLILSLIYLERTSRAAFNAHEFTLSTLSAPRGIVVNGLLGGPHYQSRAYGEIPVRAFGWRRFLPQNWRQG